MFDHPIAKDVLERIAPSGKGLLEGAEEHLASRLAELEPSELDAAIETLVGMIMFLEARQLGEATTALWRVIDTARPRVVEASVARLRTRSQAATDRGRRFDEFQGPRHLAPYSPSSDAAKAERSGAFLSRMPLVIR
jgi:hypothetical protein